MRGPRLSNSGILLALSLTAQNFASPPWIRPGSVVNEASRLPGLLAGGALAPGALVSIDGIRFNPRDAAVEIEIAGKSYPLKTIGATGEHIVALMPDLKHSGRGTMYVLSDGKRSAGSEVVTASSAFGIYTENGAGWGPASGAKLSRPGDEISLSGTGWGIANSASVRVLVGDLPASGLKRISKDGRDRLTFRIPTDAPVGCSVPVMVVSGSATSNTATIPVGYGSTCGSGRNWFDDLRAPGRRSGNILLLRSDVILELSQGKPAHFILDNLIAGFAHHLGDKAGGPFDLLPAPGSCLNWAGPLDSNQLALPSILGQNLDDGGGGLDLGPEIEKDASGVEDLDAGDVLAVSGPGGTRNAARARNKPRIYTAILGGNPPVTRIKPTPLFLSPGNYHIQSAGGSDVGAVSARVAVGRTVEWTNRQPADSLDRRQGIELEYTLPNGTTGIVFTWNIDRRKSFGGFAVCLPPIRAQRFRLPPDFIANMPATPISASDLSLGFLGVAAVPVEPFSFDLKGLDIGRAAFASMSGRTVIVK